MIIYLPMKKCIRTKVYVMESGIQAYQSNRFPGVFTYPFWKKVPLTHEMLCQLVGILKTNALSFYPHNFEIIQRYTVS